MRGRLLGPAAIVESAGIDVDSGTPANPNAIAVMEKLGLDIRGHRCQDIADLDVAHFDIIIAMKPRIGMIAVDPKAETTS